MDTLAYLDQPAKLIERQRYYLKLSKEDGAIPIFTPVTFIGYTTCPAVIVVEDGRNCRFPCERSNLRVISG